MSTKIYDAWEWHGTLLELQEFLRDVRKQVWEDAVADLAAHFTLQDLRVVELADDLKEVLHSGLYSRQGKHTNKFLPNHSASAIVYVYKRRLFVQFFGLSRNIKYTSPKLTDFHYQNQTDWPEDVSKAQWLRRGKIWDQILGRPGVPSKAGFIFEFISDADGWGLATDVFLKVHGHNYWVDDDSVYQKCTECMRRRKLWEEKQAQEQAT